MCTQTKAARLHRNPSAVQDRLSDLCVCERREASSPHGAGNWSFSVLSKGAERFIPALSELWESIPSYDECVDGSISKKLE